MFQCLPTMVQLNLVRVRLGWYRWVSCSALPVGEPCRMTLPRLRRLACRFFGGKRRNVALAGELRVGFLLIVGCAISFDRLVAS